MHLADAFIQSDLHCIQVTVLHFLSALYISFYSEQSGRKGDDLYTCTHWTGLWLHYFQIQEVIFSKYFSLSCKILYIHFLNIHMWFQPHSSAHLSLGWDMLLSYVIKVILSISIYLSICIYIYIYIYIYKLYTHTLCTHTLKSIVTPSLTCLEKIL